MLESYKIRLARPLPLRRQSAASCVYLSADAAELGVLAVDASADTILVNAIWQPDRSRYGCCGTVGAINRPLRSTRCWPQLEVRLFIMILFREQVTLPATRIYCSSGNAC